MISTTKRRRVAFCSFAALIFAILIASLSFAVFAQDREGLIPTSAGRVKYTVTEAFDVLPKTFEVTLKVPEDFSTAATVFSTRSSVTRECFNFSISAEGKPTFSVYKGVGERVTVYFNTDVRQGEWVHVSVVIDDERREARCYVNGILVDTQSAVFPDVKMENPMLIGGDYSVTSFFGYPILNLALFSDARDADEILNDYSGNITNDDLLCHYDFSDFDNSNIASEIPDLSESGNDLELFSEFYDEPAVELDDYAYSIALVGDIQVVNYKYPDKLHMIYDWIVENKDEKKIAFAVNLGDITDKNTAAEWENADAAIHSLDGVIPYSVVRGNHDKSIAEYNEHFSYADHEYMLSGSYDGTMLNTYQTFSVSGNDYLVLNLDFDIDFDLLSWANEVVESHPEHNVIITTHMNTKTDGTPLVREDALDPTGYKSDYDCEQLWNYFYSLHKNIVMVISGHIGTANIVTSQRVGVHGNTVTQILVNPQGMDGKFSGGLGLVAMLYFSEDGKRVQTQFYSTIREKYFLTSNEYRITLDPIQSGDTVHDSHNFPGDVKYNVAVHWNECVCGEKTGESEHTFGDWEISKEATAENDGVRTKTCTCGYAISESYGYLPPDRHNGVYYVIAVAVALIGFGGVGYIICKKKGIKIFRKADMEKAEDGDEKTE